MDTAAEYTIPSSSTPVDESKIEQDVLDMFTAMLEEHAAQIALELSYDMAIAPKLTVFRALEMNPAYQDMKRNGDSLGIESLTLRYHTLEYIQSSEIEDRHTKRLFIGVGVFLALVMTLGFIFNGGNTQQPTQIDYTTGRVE
jgi:hypothetical protein